ncbi:pseudaminic acid cytidylyltransferase [Acinetobacter junii]|uniref:pseudaminic acid cytidylyltransferase n=1 Tax=Acinetobacter junii TaxID=40215 RepID=UPI00124FD271|nr:pseudaminic acid cytidylyltransferase [Acinetobacter junii]MDH0718432.1 pseudaminic acid cytidylyltransferase [Acinetobacter junii]
MKIAIIPARGGSKRIPRKNIKDFCGKPMIAWSIEVAIKSACFDRIIVSTDDEEIAETAKKYGAEVPFIRPKELADDYTGTNDVVCHAIKWLKNSGVNPSEVCCIYATAPFIQVDDLQQAYMKLLESDCNYVFSVTSYAFPIQRAIKVSEDNRTEMFCPEYENTRSQDLDEAYHDAGQFYWGTTIAWLNQDSVFNLNSMAYILPRYRVQDIDTLEDWQRAELMFNALNK